MLDVLFWGLKASAEALMSCLFAACLPFDCRKTGGRKTGDRKTVERKTGGRKTGGRKTGRPSYSRSLQPSKQNIQHFKKWNLLTFLCLWVIFDLPDPDYESGSGYGSRTPLSPDPTRILIRIHSTAAQYCVNVWLVKTWAGSCLDYYFL